MVRFFISFSIPLILNCDIYPAFISPGTAASRSPHILISHFSMSFSGIISLIDVAEHESRELNTLSAMPGLKQPYATEQQHTWASSYVVHARPQGGGLWRKVEWWGDCVFLSGGLELQPEEALSPSSACSKFWGLHEVSVTQLPYVLPSFRSSTFEHWQKDC